MGEKSHGRASEANLEAVARRRIPLATAFVLMLAPWAGCADPGFVHPVPSQAQASAEALVPGIGLETAATGLDRPLLVTHDGARIFIVEQPGRILVQDVDGDFAPWLDIRRRVATCHAEQGLLGLAFLPSDPASLYIAFTERPCDRKTPRRVGDLVVEHWRDGAAGPVAAGQVLRLPQPYRNHNGGHLAFGPDGMLYIGVGDGGDHADPHRHGQDPHTWYGTILRIDVQGASYRIPPDNPFVRGGGAPEVWAYGLRNPWRFSFDGDGALWIGDVGQDEREEIDRLDPDAGGANLGWSAYEGTKRFTAPARGDVTMPVHEYTHEQEGRFHCSVTGGVVPDAGIPAIDGHYLFADYCSGIVWRLSRDGSAWHAEPVLESGMNVSSFGTGPDGTVYLVHHGGTVHRFTA